MKRATSPSLWIATLAFVAGGGKAFGAADATDSTGAKLTRA